MLLKEKIIRNLPAKLRKIDQKPKKTDHPINVAIIGRPNVGKSSIFNTLIHESRSIVRETPGTTRDTIDSILKFEELYFRFIDTAGLRRKGKRKEEFIEALSVDRAEKAIEKSSIVVLVLDAFEGLTHQDLNLLNYVEKYTTGFLIIANKVDLLSPQDKQRKAKSIFEKLSFLDWAPVVFVSAKTLENIKEILPLLKKIHQSRKIEISEEKLSEFMQKVTRKRPIPFKGTKTVKLTKIIQIKNDPPVFLAKVNDPASIHFSYRRYFKNALREKFALYGTEIKIIWQKG